MTSGVFPPKYGNVVWRSEQSITTLESKYVKNKWMIFYFNLIGPVIYFDVSDLPNYYELIACEFHLQVKRRKNAEKRESMDNKLNASPRWVLTKFPSWPIRNQQHSSSKNSHRDGADSPEQQRNWFTERNSPASVIG